MFKCLLIKLCKGFSKGGYVTTNVAHLVYFCLLTPNNVKSVLHGTICMIRFV